MMNLQPLYCSFPALGLLVLEKVFEEFYRMCFLVGNLGPDTPNKLSFPRPMEKKVGKISDTDSIKSKISPKTSRGKNSTKRHHHRHHQRQPIEQQFSTQVVTGYFPCEQL